MRVIAVQTLKEYYHKERKAEQSLLAWYKETENATWKTPNELKNQFANASIISDKRVVFNIHGNTYRLVVDIEYKLQIVFIVWLGTHQDYDKINIKTVAYVKTNQKKE
ncbi:MAG: type II toxin-antitoxin system HigB family toxin [Fimbriimonadaceae bacterium]|nr:type II toxin-antitoxin system HigB family toxin [Chitinophagales bacterium]